MVILLLFIMLIVFVLALCEDWLGQQKKYIYFFFGAVLILFAGVKEVGFDNDSENYEYFFLHHDDPYMLLAVEYSYILLSRFFMQFTNDVHVMFLFYSGIGVLLKMTAIRKLSKFWFLPLVVYLGNYYILHDLTQIRACVVSGIFLLSIVPLAEGNKRQAAALLAIGCVFHYSAFALFPALLLNNKEMSLKERLIWALLVPAGYVLYFLKVNLFTEIPIPYIGDKLETYQELNEHGILGDEINVFNAVFIVTWLIYLYIMLFYDVVKQHNKYLPLMLKLTGISVFSFTAFSFLPVLAFRISELYGIVEIIIFANIYYTIKPRWLSKTFVGIVGLTLFFVNVFYSEILHP